MSHLWLMTSLSSCGCFHSFLSRFSCDCFYIVFFLSKFSCGYFLFVFFIGWFFPRNFLCLLCYLSWILSKFISSISSKFNESIDNLGEFQLSHVFLMSSIILEGKSLISISAIFFNSWIDSSFISSYWYPTSYWSVVIRCSRLN